MKNKKLDTSVYPELADAKRELKKYLTNKKGKVNYNDDTFELYTSYINELKTRFDFDFKYNYSRQRVVKHNRFIEISASVETFQKLYDLLESPEWKNEEGIWQFLFGLTITRSTAFSSQFSTRDKSKIRVLNSRVNKLAEIGEYLTNHNRGITTVLRALPMPDYQFPVFILLVMRNKKTIGNIWYLGENEENLNSGYGVPKGSLSPKAQTDYDRMMAGAIRAVNEISNWQWEATAA